MGKILIIEDDPLVSRMYGKVMKFEGMDVETAADGKEGIEKAKSIKPNLIFCDIMMPKMNGIEVLEHLKADPETAGIPVVMLTNLSGTHDAEAALQKGAVAYMVKSEYKPKDVANKAKEMIAQPAAAPAAATPAPVAAPAAPTPPPAAPVPSVPTQPQTQTPPAATPTPPTTTNQS